MAEEKKKIEDFGEKFWGARKDLYIKWKDLGIDFEDFNGASVAEKLKFIVKENVLPKIDYQALKDKGYSPNVLWYYNIVLKSLPAKAKVNTDEKYADEKLQNYINFLKNVKNGLFEFVKKDEDIKGFFEHIVEMGIVSKKVSGYYEASPEYRDYVTNKWFKVVQTNLRQIAKDVEENQFLYTDEEKQKAQKDSLLSQIQILKFDNITSKFNQDHRGNWSLTCKSGAGYYILYNLPNKEEFRENTYFVLDASNGKIKKFNFETIEEAKEYRNSLVEEKIKEKNNEEKKNDKANNDKKKKFTPSRVEIISRTADFNWIKGNVDGTPYLDELKFRGGEFGNWENQEERQINLNYAYESFKDLAYILGIDEKDISGNGRLGIAFGSRGRSGAIAHYEPDSDVINLTRMKGAGSLAHEWGHFLDNMLYSEKKKTMASESSALGDPSPIIKPLINMMKYRFESQSLDEFKDEKEKAVARADKNLNFCINAGFPTSNLNEENLKRREAAIKALKEDMIKNRNSYFYFAFPPHGAKAVEPEGMVKFNDLFKEIKGYTIKMEQRKNIAIYVDSYVSAVTREYDPKKEIRKQTQFYKDSQYFDKTFSKTDKGYWSSNCEMFARAFSCYVKDKFEEKGIHNPYLTGHSDSYFTINEETKAVVRAFPVGEERKLINQKFDELINSIKQETDIFHEKEYDLTAFFKQDETKEEKHNIYEEDWFNQKLENISYDISYNNIAFAFETEMIRKEKEEYKTNIAEYHKALAEAYSSVLVYCTNSNESENKYSRTKKDLSRLLNVLDPVIETYKNINEDMVKKIRRVLLEKRVGMILRAENNVYNIQEEKINTLFKLGNELFGEPMLEANDKKEEEPMEKESESLEDFKIKELAIRIYQITLGKAVESFNKDDWNNVSSIQNDVEINPDKYSKQVLEAVKGKQNEYEKNTDVIAELAMMEKKILDQLPLGEMSRQQMEKLSFKEMEEKMIQDLENINFKSSIERQEYFGFLSKLNISKYSLNNRRLLFSQGKKRGVSSMLFATMKEFNAMGTSIKAGSKAFIVNMPGTKTCYYERKEDGFLSLLPFTLDANEITEREKRVKRGELEKQSKKYFYLNPVMFSIDQTKMPEQDRIDYLKRFNAHNTSIENAKLLESMKNCCKKMGIDVSEEEMDKSEIGHSEYPFTVDSKTGEKIKDNSRNNKIVVKKDMTVDAKISVIGYELGHYMLQHGTPEYSKELNATSLYGLDTADRDIQAQCFSHLLLEGLGVDSESEYSLKYINGYLDSSKRIENKGKLIDRDNLLSEVNKSSLHCHLSIVYKASDLLLGKLRKEEISEQDAKELNEFKPDFYSWDEKANKAEVISATPEEKQEQNQKNDKTQQQFKQKFMKGKMVQSM